MSEDYGTQQSSTPTDGASAVSTTEPVQQSSGGNEGTPSPAAEPASSSPPGQQPTAAPASGQGSPDWVSIRQAAYDQYGIDLRQMPDDGAALRHLIGQAAQAREAQQYAQRYLQHASQFEQYLQTQQQQQQQAPQKDWWNPPEYNPAWRQMVSRDPQTGEFKLTPGAPPDVLPKYLAYEQYRRDFADKLTSDPVSTLKPLIETVAKQMAQAQVQEHLGSYQDKVYADSFVNQNSNWLHQRDPNTNQLIVDPFSQQPLLSPAGQRFKGYVEQLQRTGITNIRQQEQIARGWVERDIAVAQLQQYQAGAQNQQQKQQFLASNNTRTPNAAGAVAGTRGQGPDNQKLSLSQRLAQQFQAHGVTDADFNAGTHS